LVEAGPRPFETKHERTLSVPYVFRNHLISREEIAGAQKARLKVAG
jgi:hypothetical protein